MLRESLALDVSLGSGTRGTPRVPTPDDQDQSVEEFSDWDSWDGENEVRTRRHRRSTLLFRALTILPLFSPSFPRSLSPFRIRRPFCKSSLNFSNDSEMNTAANVAQVQSCSCYHYIDTTKYIVS